jgi:hypothetical protein
MVEVAIQTAPTTNYKPSNKYLEMNCEIKALSSPSKVTTTKGRLLFIGRFVVSPEISNCAFMK